MTLQEIFDRVVDHLRKQGEPSTTPALHTNSVRCLYRGPNGKKCAVGALITDAVYSPHIEGGTVSDVGVRFALGASGIPDDGQTLSLLSELQDAHDSTARKCARDIRAWLPMVEHRLEYIANWYGLTLKPANPVRSAMYKPAHGGYPGEVRYV